MDYITLVAIIFAVVIGISLTMAGIALYKVSKCMKKIYEKGEIDDERL